jgi:hypothetical protein
VKNRRRSERQSALWMCHCHLEDEPSDLWRECAITDISKRGVGIDLYHPDVVELLGLWQDGEIRLHPNRRIRVRLELGPSVDITVAGEVRNAGSGPDGLIRAGIEFVGLSKAERSIVGYLERRAVKTMPRHAQGVGRIAVASPPTQESPESPVSPEFPVVSSPSLLLDFDRADATEPSSASRSGI